MKKYILYILSAAAVFAACTKTELRDGSDKKKVSENAIVLSATHENNGSQADKTSLQSDDSVLWTDGDCIKLLWEAGSAVSEPLELDADAASADFTVEVESGTVPAYAVYPAGTAATYNGSSLSVTIPATQDGSFASAAIELAPVTEGKTIAFKNLGALLEISVSSADVASIVITAYGEKTIAGTASVSFSGGIPAVDAVSAEASSITLSGLGGAGTYYAAILPDAELSDGFYIELRDASDNVIGQKFTGKALTAARKKIIGLGTIAAESISATFVKVSASGSGDGSSWDNAMSWSDLNSGIAAGSVSGSVFMAGGTYESLATAGTTIAAGSNFSIYGGYNPASTGKDLSKRSTANYPTEFDGLGTSRIFVWNAATISTVFDGITFKNAYKSSTDVGSAIIINSCNSAKFNNCIVKDCIKVSTGTSNGTGGGGAVRAQKGTIEFSNCTFSGNSASGVGFGGVISPGNNESTAVLNLTKCSFLNNTAEGKGGVLYLPAETSTTTIVDCTFEGNQAAEGGVVYINSACTLSSSNSRYINNRATATTSSDVGGGCYRIAASADITFDGDSFEGNSVGNWETSANGSGAVIFADAAATIRVNDCYLEGNYSGSRGAIRSKASASILMMNNCRIRNSRVYTYGSALHTNGICAIHNSAFQSNSNKNAGGASTIYVGGGKMFISNTCIRLSADSGAGLYAASGPATIVNSTFVNSANDSGTASKQVAVKSKGIITSYGHNIYSKLYEETAGTYSLENAGHIDVQYTLDQEWVGGKYNLIKWTQWNDGGARPEGFVEATPARVEAAIEAFDTANGSNFKSWLQSLTFDGGNALQTDIRGIARSTEAIWPGSYDNSATYPLP